MRTRLEIKSNIKEGTCLPDTLTGLYTANKRHSRGTSYVFCTVFGMNSPFLSVRSPKDVVEEAATDFAGVLNVFYLTSRSIEDGLAESIIGEMRLFTATCESVVPSSRLCLLTFRSFERFGVPI